VGAAASACSSSKLDDESLTLRVGVLPDQDNERLLTQYEPLLRYLDDAAGVSTELYLPESYDDLLQRFGNGDLDIGWFGGLTFLFAQDVGATPLVMRNVDLEFTSDILVSASASGQSLDDFIGASFAFGPELSTSGHLMPRYFVSKSVGVPDDVFGSVVHSSGHDETVRWVRDGVVDVGAANSLVVEAMINDGSVSSDDIRVLARTPPYRNYVWATSPDVGDEVRDRLLQAFLALDPTNPEHQEVLELVSAVGYVPATTDDFVGLRAAAEALGLLGAEGGTAS